MGDIAVQAKCTDWPTLLRDNERERNADGPNEADMLDEGSHAVAGDASEVSEAEYRESVDQQVKFRL